MFYSHEILTSQKYGVATVWLVATLGSKSNLKKVNRKAIAEVDVPKACDTILDPDAPLALRLQGSLLYGLARVYSQQCGYVLADARATQNNIKTLSKLVKGSFLDSEAGKARPSTLMLQDDPAFLPEFPSLDFDLAQLDLSLFGTSKLNSSILSPPGSASNISLDRGSQNSLLRLHLPRSDTGVFDIDSAGFTVASSHRSLQDDQAQAAPFQKEGEEEGFLPDVDFEFDADGNVRELITTDRTLVTSLNLPPQDSDSILGRRSGRGAEDAILLDENLDRPLGFDERATFDDLELQHAEHVVEKQAISRLPRSSSSARLNESSSESAEAPIRQRRPQSVKALPVDLVMELRNSELAEWNSGYIANMRKGVKRRQAVKAAVQAKKNAQHWVLNSGIAGIGRGLGDSELVSPLGMFIGEVLMRTLAPYPDRVTSVKRAPDFDEIEGVPESEERRKIRRVGNESQVMEGEPMNMADEEIGPNFDENEIEIGRAAMTELEDQSSTMPWNQSASMRRSRLDSSTSKLRRLYDMSMGGFPTSAGASATGLELGVLGSAPRRASRLTSASPLSGRGRGGVIERLSSLEIADEDNDIAVQARDVLDLDARDQFEVFGPAATVDTQTAIQIQWMNQAFEQESFNFMEFVLSSAKQRTPIGDERDKTDSRTYLSEIAFGDLLRPESNSKIVASQAFLHLLSLATKGLLTARQGARGGEMYICPTITT